jgi:hypothetical protein
LRGSDVRFGGIDACTALATDLERLRDRDAPIDLGGAALGAAPAGADLQDRIRGKRACSGGPPRLRSFQTTTGADDGITRQLRAAEERGDVAHRRTPPFFCLRGRDESNSRNSGDNDMQLHDELLAEEKKDRSLRVDWRPRREAEAWAAEPVR